MSGAATRPVRLVVVVVAWNSREDSLRCVASLRREIGPDDEVVLVDNGSEDGTADAVGALHAWVTVVRHERNAGFAAGCNAGIRRALERGAEWVLLLNADTELAPGSLAHLLGHAESRPRTDAFQPLLVSAAAPDTIDGAGHVIFRVPGAVDALRGRPVAEAPPEPCEVFGACGAAALLRADALRRAAPLDEGFFLLCEDVDLMFRIRASGGAVELVPAARILHRRGISGDPVSRGGAARRTFWLDRNTVALALRWWPARWLVVAAPVLAVRALRALARRRRAGGLPCLPFWVASLRARPANRASMRRAGADRWFALRPAPTTRPAGT